MELDYQKKLVSFYETHKRMPTYSEMLALFKFKSKNAVYRLVQKMLDAGVVAKDSLGRLLPTAFFDEIPLIGSVKAGFPSQVEEMRDTVDLQALLVGERKSDTYLFEVDGDSMVEAHIADGDMVVVLRTNKANPGEIVIAEIDGEHTMKYFRKDKQGRPWLEPANKDFKPLYPKYSFSVVGVVKAVLRTY